MCILVLITTDSCRVKYNLQIKDIALEMGPSCGTSPFWRGIQFGSTSKDKNTSKQNDWWSKVKARRDRFPSESHRRNHGCKTAGLRTANIAAGPVPLGHARTEVLAAERGNGGWSQVPTWGELTLPKPSLRRDFPAQAADLLCKLHWQGGGE